MPGERATEHQEITKAGKAQEGWRDALAQPPESRSEDSFV